MSLRNWILLALFIAAAPVLVTDAAAQTPRRERVEARRDWRLYNRTPWYSNAGVRQQLKIDDATYNKLNDKYIEYYTPYEKVVTAAPATTVSEAERQKEIAAAYGKFNTGVNTATTEIITDPQIRDRYNQLHYQYQGYHAFNDPTVRQRLKLTDEQVQAFNKYNTEWNTRMNTYAGEYATDPNTVTKTFPQTWKQTRENINTTLTPEQRKVWGEMIGQPYDFTPDVYFGPTGEVAVPKK